MSSLTVRVAAKWTRVFDGSTRVAKVPTEAGPHGAGAWVAAGYADAVEALWAGGTPSTSLKHESETDGPSGTTMPHSETPTDTPPRSSRARASSSGSPRRAAAAKPAANAYYEAKPQTAGKASEPVSCSCGHRWHAYRHGEGNVGRCLIKNCGCKAPDGQRPPHRPELPPELEALL